MNDIRTGQKIVVLGYAGTYGTERLLEACPDRIRQRFGKAYLQEELKRLFSLPEIVPDISEGFRTRYGVTSICPVGRGGVLSALWNLLDADGRDETGKYHNPGRGCRFRYDRIPCLQFPIELCELFDLLPYRLYSENCCLLTMDDPLLLQEENPDLPVSVIGFVTDGHARIRTDGTEIAYLTNEHGEELEKVLGVQG